MTTKLVLTTILCMIFLSGITLAQIGTIVPTPDQVKWGPAKGLPTGWQAAVLAGAPDKKGPYVQRIKLPPNALAPPHTHPDTENITVLEGSFGIGEGSVADKAKGKVLTAGSFYRLPANTPHFAWAGADGATIQIHGVGPSGINMLKPPLQN
jgi:quercetin dioxygenase-like cupin family protein